MRRVLWHVEAHADIESIYDFFAEKDARVATLLVDRIMQAVVGLAKRDMGRPGRMPKLREKSVPRTRYIIADRIRRNDLIILRIIHSSQNWPATAWPKSQS